MKAAGLPRVLSGAFNLTFLYPIGCEKGFLGKIKGFLMHTSSKLPHFLPAIPPMPTPLHLSHTALLAKTRSCSWATVVEDKHTGQAAEGSMHHGGKRNAASGLRHAILGIRVLHFLLWREWTIRVFQSAFYTLHPYKDCDGRFKLMSSLVSIVTAHLRGITLYGGLSTVHKQILKKKVVQKTGTDSFQKRPTALNVTI